MAQSDQIPYIDVDEMHEALVGFYNDHAHPETLFAILGAMSEQADFLEEIEQNMFEHRGARFDEWREELNDFSNRIEWYAEAVEGADDPYDANEVIAPPLFEGKYPEEIEGPKNPDNQTIWKLANKLVVIGDQRDLSEASLEEMQEHYRTFVEMFWNGLADELTRQVEGEDVDAEIEKSIDRAKELAAEQPEEVVGLRARSEGRSMAPFLLAAGAIWLMSKRKGRR
jgi:hypothetical protein